MVRRKLKLSSILKRKQSKQGPILVCRTKAGLRLYAIAKGNDITGWKVTNSKGASLPFSLQASGGSKGVTITVTITVCVEVPVITDPPQHPPATGKDCTTTTIEIETRSFRIPRD
jgi:hypothetical protein